MKQRALLLRLHNESLLQSSDEYEQDSPNSFDMIFRANATQPITSSPPSMVKATPIVDYENMEIDIVSSCAQEDDESALTDDIVDDLSLGDDESSTDLYPDHRRVTPLAHDQQRSSLYSFYFENFDDNHEDHFPLPLDDDDSIGKVVSILDCSNEGLHPLWEASAPVQMMQEDLRASPAQVSLCSIDLEELRRINSM